MTCWSQRGCRTPGTRWLPAGVDAASPARCPRQQHSSRSTSPGRADRSRSRFPVGDTVPAVGVGSARDDPVWHDDHVRRDRNAGREPQGFPRGRSREQSEPDPLFIPCHRVIGADGSLTGYGGGLPLKGPCWPSSSRCPPAPPDRSPLRTTGGTALHAAPAGRRRLRFGLQVDGSLPGAGVAQALKRQRDSIAWDERRLASLAASTRTSRTGLTRVGAGPLPVECPGSPARIALRIRLVTIAAPIRTELDGPSVVCE